MTRFGLWVLERLQRRCDHPDDHCTFDILDGDFHGGAGGDQAVTWCRRCGATRRVFDVWGEGRKSEWREPRATWTRGQS